VLLAVDLITDVNETVELAVTKQHKPPEPSHSELQVRWSCSSGHGRAARQRRSARGEHMFCFIDYVL